MWAGGVNHVLVLALTLPKIQKNVRLFTNSGKRHSVWESFQKHLFIEKILILTTMTFVRISESPGPEAWFVVGFCECLPVEEIGGWQCIVRNKSKFGIIGPRSWNQSLCLSVIVANIAKIRLYGCTRIKIEVTRFGNPARNCIADYDVHCSVYYDNFSRLLLTPLHHPLFRPVPVSLRAPWRLQHPCRRIYAERNYVTLNLYAHSSF